MNIQIKWNHTGEILTVVGTQKSKVNGRILLKIKGWKKDSLLDLKMGTTVDGQPLTPEMFVETTSNNLNEIKEVLMWVNGYGTKKIDGPWADLISEIQIKAEGLEGTGENYGKTESANKFVADVCKSVRQFNKCSEKQAYIIAKYADENGIKFQG